MAAVIYPTSLVHYAGVSPPGPASGSDYSGPAVSMGDQHLLQPPGRDRGRKWSFETLTTLTAASTPTSCTTAEGYNSDESDDLDPEVLGAQALYDESIDREPHIGLVTYQEQCKSHQTAPQSTVCARLSKPELRLPNRNLGPSGVLPIARALKNNLRVMDLDLSGNGARGEAIVELARMLKTNHVITQLNLSDNGLGPLGAAAIADMLRYNKGLTSMDISYNKFDDESAKFLAIGIQATTRIATMNLSHNEIGSAGGLHIGNAIGLNESLQNIDLSWNHIRRQGAVMVCKGAQKNTTVTHLNLAWNGVGHEGSLALKALLKANTYLTELDVTSNRLDWPCVNMISEGLLHNDTLEVFRIGRNPMTTFGCLTLLESISNETSKVRVLDLKGIPVLIEFQLLVDGLKQIREFECCHGGYVLGHDVIGKPRAVDKNIAPMKKLMDFVWRGGLRLSDLFRSFDKNANLSISNEEFIRRIKNSGIPVDDDEIESIMRQMNRKGDPKYRREVNFKDLVTGVRAQINKERTIRVMEEGRRRRAELTVRTILNPRVPPVDRTHLGVGSAQHDRHTASHSTGYRPRPFSTNHTTSGPYYFQKSLLPNDSFRSVTHKDRGKLVMGGRSSTPVKSEVDLLADLMTSLDLAPARLPAPTSRDADWLAQQPAPTKVMSLSRPLGAKAKPFGSLGAKKKKRKKTKKRGKTTRCGYY